MALYDAFDRRNNANESYNNKFERRFNAIEICIMSQTKGEILPLKGVIT